MTGPPNELKILVTSFYGSDGNHCEHSYHFPSILTRVRQAGGRRTRLPIITFLMGTDLKTSSTVKFLITKSCDFDAILDRTE